MEFPKYGIHISGLTPEILSGIVSIYDRVVGTPKPWVYIRVPLTVELVKGEIDTTGVFERRWGSHFSLNSKFVIECRSTDLDALVGFTYHPELEQGNPKLQEALDRVPVYEMAVSSYLLEREIGIKLPRSR